MTICTFCGREENDFKGVHLIKNTGTVEFFCSSKCRKNALKLKRDKRKIKWTEAYRIVLKRETTRKKDQKKLEDAKIANKEIKKEDKIEDKEDEKEQGK